MLAAGKVRRKRRFARSGRGGSVHKTTLPTQCGVLVGTIPSGTSDLDALQRRSRITQIFALGAGAGDWRRLVCGCAFALIVTPVMKRHAQATFAEHKIGTCTRLPDLVVVRPYVGLFFGVA